MLVLVLMLMPMLMPMLMLVLVLIVNLATPDPSILASSTNVDVWTAVTGDFLPSHHG